MTTALVAIVAVLTLAVLILAYELHGMPRLRRRCVVNLTDGGAVTGVLWTRRGHWLVLKDAAHIAAQSAVEVRMPGEALVDRRSVSFIQVEP